MKDKKLKRLRRAELLELLLEQTRETERLRERLAEAEIALTQRFLKLREAGDLAHAVVAINNVMEDAQKAAQQYLDNIAAMEEETRKTCEKMIDDARQEAARIIENAENSQEQK